MSELTRKAEVNPIITFPVLENETLDEACDRFFNHLDKFNCFYINSCHKGYTVDDDGNEKSTMKNVVIVKHENCGAKYVFLVPDGHELKAGDYVVVDTKHGKALATCLCDSFAIDMSDTDKTKSVFSAFGVDKPTACVIGKFNCEWWDK